MLPKICICPHALLKSFTALNSLKIIGSRVVHLVEADSTNNYALNLVRTEYVPDGTIVRADYQHSGRGEAGNQWRSQAGKNLTFTLVLKPPGMQAVHQFRLNKMVSLAIYDFLARHVQNVSIKWPNDIMIGDAKVGGVLIENNLKGAYIQNCFIGVGLNINQVEFPAMPYPVSSLQLESGQAFDLDLALMQLSELIQARYLKLLATKNENLKGEYLRRLYRYNKWYLFDDKIEQFKGRIIGVEPTGRLVVERENRTQYSYAHKEIRFLERV